MNNGMAHFQGTDEGLRELALFAGAGGGILGGHLLGWRCTTHALEPQWTETEGADEFSATLFGDFHLHAWGTGEWKVMRTGPPTEVVAHWEEQTTGSDLADAQRRAVAAAMIQQSLLDNG